VGQANVDTEERRLPRTRDATVSKGIFGCYGALGSAT
jgi:hypothetical protein